jgi:hypothetical protein
MNVSGGQNRTSRRANSSPSVVVSRFGLTPLCRFASVSFVALVCLAAPSNAHAELVFFANGGSMNVKAHRAEGGFLVLTLRGGGEVELAASAIARIEPDEVPYPEDHSDVQLKPAAVSGLDDTTSEYEPIIRRVSAEQGVDVRLVRAVIQVESAYQPRARSPKGAVGLMQLLPATARQYGVTNPYDPAANIEAGIRHLKALLQRFPLAQALAAYNAGEATVERFRGIPPYPETRNYVSSILKLIN